MARVVRSLEEIEADREKRVALSYLEELGLRALMRPGINKTPRLGKRPVAKGGAFNAVLLARSPGSSRLKGLDFVKAVYSDRTGQEPLY